jgi:hypothetical protein
MRNRSDKQPHSDATSVRFGQRMPLDLTVDVMVDGRALGGAIVRNASISGALLETALDLAVHTNLLVTVSLSDGRQTSLRALSACVVRVDAFGVGIEWRDMAAIDVVQLLQLSTPDTDPGQGNSGISRHTEP